MAIGLRTLYVMDDGTLYYRGQIMVAEDDLGRPDWFSRSVAGYVAAHFADLADITEAGVKLKLDHDVTAAGAEAAILFAYWVQMIAPRPFGWSRGMIPAGDPGIAKMEAALRDAFADVDPAGYTVTVPREDDHG